MKTVIKTQCGRRFDLSRAFPVKRDFTAPYGAHNFAVYKANGTYYIKGYNTGTSEQVLNMFELISENEALQYLR
ncbi:MAG: hypothetical protein COW65_09075 [Cytophagales bacterium CG18_big_fil_WC_8_21_14_2_50_42_9]|nr:MAG: hypothetical protein COW65_09075 [Cytophagales bacterium CG18_big_fil_WC_8_21_14_2_50_42_9]